MKNAASLVPIVAALVVVAALAASAVYVITSEDPEETGETYYFFLDGFDANSGWHTGVGDSPAVAFNSAMKKSHIVAEVRSDGWILSLDGKSGTYNEQTMTGTGFSIYEYLSTDVANPEATSFGAGPVITKVTSNIVYVSYSAYLFDANWNAVYDLSPTTTTNAKLLSEGPFSDENYKPLAPVSDKYYIYIDGIDNINGWYSATGTDIKDGVTKALSAANITIDISETGWINSINGVSGTYNAATNSGTGFGVFAYCSSDLSNVNVGYFIQGPVITKVTSNIVYVSFSEYVFGLNYETIYSLCPSTSVGNLLTGGPFGNEANVANNHYYLFLDGIGNGHDGWHVGFGYNAETGFSNAMDCAGIEYDISETGWIDSIADKKGTFDNETYTGAGFSVYEYMSKKADAYNAFYIRLGPVLTEVAGNIVYVSFSNYSFGEDGSMIYELNPFTTENDSLDNGPFDDENYAPLDYGQTFHIYLSGYGAEVEGWYTGTGENAAQAFAAALTKEGIDFELASNGWILSINGIEDDMDFDEDDEVHFYGGSVYSYGSTVLSNPYSGYFLMGPVMPDAIGNIFFVCYGEYTFDENDMYYLVNPTTVDQTYLSQGPFATA